MAIAAAKISKLEKKIFECLRKIKGVNGRLELIKTFKNNIKVFIDFAHTPDALLKSLSALKSSTVRIYQLFLVVVVIVILKRDH